MKILLLDIETSPNVAHVWGLWQQNVALNQLMESSYTLCWAAKWHDQKEIMFESVHRSKPKQMIRKIHDLLSEADMVVHYHGTSFDMPTLNKEFLLHDIQPPPPVKELDLLKVVRKRFRFPSNKLDYVAQRLGLGKKFEHEGHMLWIKCMNNDPAAWKCMEKYNRHDVVLLGKLYDRLLPWMNAHANHSLYGAEPSCCPNCGKTSFQRRGLAYTKTVAYHRYQCTACGTWFRDRMSSKLAKAAQVAL